MKRLQARNPKKMEHLARELPVQYVVFDILYHQENRVMDRPLMERKALLEEAIEEDNVLVQIRFVEGNATGLFQATGEAGLEGIVIKRKDAPYRPGIRSGSWRKVIHWKETEVVITGYRKDEPGWLIAIEEDVRLRPGGIMELGMGPTERKAFYPVARSIKTHEDRRFVYLEPRIRCRVKYKKRTHAGFLREPVFRGFVL